MASTFTYDTGGTVGQVRMLIQDNDLTVAAEGVPRAQWTALLTDEEITQILSWTNSNVFRAAAIALRTIAAHRSLLAKRIAAGPYTEDATQVARELRATAKDFDNQADQLDLETGDTEVLQEMPWTDFAFEQILANEDAAVG